MFQQVKSRHDRCSAVYLTLFAAELLLLIAFTGLGLLTSFCLLLAVSKILFRADRLHKLRSASLFACFSGRASFKLFLFTAGWIDIYKQFISSLNVGMHSNTHFHLPRVLEKLDPCICQPYPQLAYSVF